jgi:transcriptional regulator with XRE-family HTH domain
MMRIKELRKQRGLTMRELGKSIGVAESTVSLYENGKREPDHLTLIKLADFFGVSVDYLLSRTDLPFSIQDDTEKIQPAAKGDELDERLISLLVDLSPSEVRRVEDFVAGLKASRKE